jgi:hypothetical protein
MSDIFWDVETGRRLGNQNAANAVRCFQIQSKTSVTVMVLKKPAEAFAPHFKAQMAFTGERGCRLGQRLNECDYPFPALCGALLG